MIEIMRFRLAPGTGEEEFLAADRRLQEEFADHQPGLLRRTTARGEDGDWIVIDLWRSAADADACDQRWDDDPVAQGFMALLDRSSPEAVRVPLSLRFPVTTVPGTTVRREEVEIDDGTERKHR
ncbi:MAG TPA: hypothetical protein VHY58_08245 [Streptosporangiaceae bacterium]|nr:hypothetical protein [Streptosporangiaceae bacterium]